ncbi:MAG: sigma factor-like helix-turn-helix DNA-binding protein [Prosthecobacter sp.]|uniref:sigma factor-like helix-turn-helix DNA-binding protein n=1 Tax=Prosthecobacter sp. TaxID=1965333 RepID=UPI003BAF066A
MNLTHGEEKKERRQRLMLGLAILAATRVPDRRYTLDEIAAYCGCPRSTISMIEWDAIKKLKRRARSWKFQQLREEVQP